MKLLAVLMLSLAALAWADTSYQNFQTYQSQVDQTNPPYSNYYERQPSRRNSKGLQGTASRLAGILQRVLSPVRRQGLDGLNLSGILPLIAVAGVIGLAVIGVGYFASTYNNSGRGLDTDEWEVDHSIWMNQLQKDFENSWTVE